MADYIFGAQTPAGQSFDAAWHTLGVDAGVSVAATMVGGRAWWPTTDPVNFLWLVYRISDQQIMVQVDLAATVPAPVNSAWNTFTDAAFTIPPGGSVTLNPAAQYAVVVATNGDFVFNAAFSYPIGAGIITAVASRFFNGGSGATFPTGTNTTDGFFADVLVQAAATVVNGSASLTAQSSLTATATVTQLASAVLSAQSSLTAVAVNTAQGAASLSASAVLSATGVVTQVASAALSAQSALTAAGVVTVYAAVSLSAQSNLTALAVDDIEIPGTATPGGTTPTLTPAGATPVLTPAGTTPMLTPSGTS